MATLHAPPGQQQTVRDDVRALQLRCGVVDLDRRLVTRDSETIRLTEMEVDLLAYLAKRPGEAISLDELLVEVWGYRPGVVSRAPTFTLRRLRQKIELDATEPDHLQTAHGKGIRFMPLAPDDAKVPALALRSGPSRCPTNLQPEGTILRGRAEELDRLQQFWSQGPGLIVVSGTGGVGKTRLARDFGWAIAEQQEATEVWFCDLAPARTTDAALAIMAEALGVPATGPTLRSVMLRLARAITARGRVLIIIDNIEQLPPAAAELIADLAAAAAPGTILATTRGPFPAQCDHHLSLNPLDESAAIDLLTEAARSSAPDLVIDEAARDCFTRIQARVDGVPLALELAGARLSHLSPAQLEERLSDQFAVLNRSDRAGHRHGTLHEAIAWSWDLLRPLDRQVLACTSVFLGPFRLEWAEALLMDVVPVPSVLECLERLEESGLFRCRRDATGQPRFEPFQAIRSFAEAQLVTCSDAKQAHTRHWTWALDRTRELTGPKGDDRPPRSEMVGLIDELAAAHGRALEAGEVWVHLKLARDIDRLQAGTAPLATRRAALEASLEACPAPPPAGGDERVGWLEVQRARGEILRMEGQLDEAARVLGPVLDLARSSGDDWLLGRVILTVAAVHHSQRADAEATACYAEALSLQDRTGDALGRGMVLLNQANLAWQQVRPIDEMIGLAEDAVAAFSKTGHRHWIALAYRVLGRNCRAGGLFGEAAGYFHQALAVGETLELHDLVASVRLSLGIHQIDQADFDRAESFLRQAAATAARCGQVETYRMSQYLIALSALIRGDLAVAERMLVPATMEQDRGIEQLPEILLSLLRRIQGLPTEAKRRLARMAGDGDTVEQYQVQVRSLLAATLADLDDPECHSWLDQARADAVRLKQARTSPFVELCAGHVYLFEARQDPSGDGRDRAGAALDEARGLRGMAGDLALPTQILERALAHHDER